jgi:VanZ family protein
MKRLTKKLSEPKNLLFVGIFYTLFITVALLAPVSEIPKVEIPFLDKLVHVIMHALLIIIWLAYVFLGDKSHISIKNIFVVLFICFSYGIIIEALQHWFTLSRKFDFFDIIANGIGDLLGLLSFWIVRIRIVH